MRSDISLKEEKTESIFEESLQKVFAGDKDAAMEAVIRRLEADLQNTKESLRLTVEQYENSVEEMKASNEELLAINEELRSTTEELEINKKELQSVSEELMTVNQELKANEEFNRTILESSPDCIKIIDEAGRLQYMNANGLCVLEIDDFTSVKNNFWWELWTEETIPLVKESVAKAMRGETAHFQAFCPTAKGTPKWWDVIVSPIHDANGKATRLISVSRDITENKAAEEILRESEEKYRNLFNSIDEGFCTIEMIFDENEKPVDYLFIEMNPVFEKQTGLVDATGKTARELVPNLEEYWFEVYGKVALTGESVRFENHSAPMNRWFDVYASRVGNEQNRCVALVFTDITTRRQADDALREADRRKDEFLATLAHELRNPLAPIRSGLEIIRRATSDKPARMDALGIIERQTAQMVRLIDDLLDISRITQGKIRLRKTRFELKKAIDMALESSRDLLEMTGLKLIVSLPDEPIYLDADFTRVAQIFLNILNNSVKYTQPGGEIRLTAEKRDGEAVIGFFDTGIGIPPEMLPHIFEMFSQLENDSEQTRGGLGIGLSVVERLVEMHGGTITAFSAGKGKGSEFIVYLPLATEQSAKTEDELPSAADTAQHALLQTTENGKSRQSKEKRILVVDDNADAAQMLEVLLKLNGHEVRLAFDGETGLAENEEFQPEAALLDIGLPGISGYETARRIREKNPDILLIAVSGWGTENDRQRSSEAGFNYHLVKPVEPRRFGKIVGRTGGKKLVRKDSDSARIALLFTSVFPHQSIHLLRRLCRRRKYRFQSAFG